MIVLFGFDLLLKIANFLIKLIEDNLFALLHLEGVLLLANKVRQLIVVSLVLLSVLKLLEDGLMKEVVVLRDVRAILIESVLEVGDVVHDKA